MSEADTWRERGSRQLFAGEWIRFDDVFRAVALVRPAELRAPRTTVAAMLGEATSEPDDESEWEVVTPERRIALFATDEVPALMLCAPTSWLPDEPAAPTLDSITSYAGPVLEHVDQIVETPQTRFDAAIPKPSQDLGAALGLVHAEMACTVRAADRHLSGCARVLFVDEQAERKIILATRP